MSKKKKDSSEIIVIEEYIPGMYGSVKIVIGRWKYAKKHIPEDIHDSFQGKDYAARCCFKYGTRSDASLAVIHSKYFKISTVTHEIVHAVNYLLYSIGCVPSFTNDEVQAHLIHFLVDVAEIKLKEFENGKEITK